jgi:hypothetical protein
MADLQEQQADTQAPVQDHAVRRWGWAIVVAFVAAILSPLAVLAPKRVARWCSDRPGLVLLWQMAMLGGYFAYQLASYWLDTEFGRAPFYVFLELVPSLFMLTLVALFGAYIMRPVGSAWQESQRRSFWRNGLVLTSFMIAMSVVIASMTWLFETRGQDMEVSILKLYGYRVYEAAQISLILLWLVQILRGLAAAGGGTVPSLPPICRECGYSLEGVAEFYRQGPTTDRPAVRICSECGADLAESLEPSVRMGTPWTRGENLSIASWARTLGQTLVAPSRFYSSLPLDGSRKAAMRFWLSGIGAVVLLVAAIFAADYSLCARTHLVDPLLPRYSDTYISGIPRLDPDTSAPIVSPSETTTLWLLDCSMPVLGTAIGILSATTLVLSLSANRVGKLMSKHRTRNMYPVGLLMMSYLSPVVLTAGVAVLAMVVISRITVPRILVHLSPGIRRYLDDPEIVATLATIAVVLGGLVWLHLLSRRAIKAIQYANHSM